MPQPVGVRLLISGVVSAAMAWLVYGRVADTIRSLPPRRLGRLGSSGLTPSGRRIAKAE